MSESDPSDPGAPTSTRWLDRAPAAELVAFAILLGVAGATWWLVTGWSRPGQMLPPIWVSLLLIANLVPAMALLVLVGRRIAIRRAARSAVGGGRLHVRLVALFSMLASVPMLLVTIFASLLFQYGVEFWFSDRARGMLENASVIARENYRQLRLGVADNADAMAGDLREALRQVPIDSRQFYEVLATQTYYRNLSEAALLRSTPSNGLQALALVNPYDRVIEEQVSRPAIAVLEKGASRVVLDEGGRIKALIRFNGSPGLYLYIARVYEPRMVEQARRSQAVLTDYRALLGRSRSLQLQFNAALLLISLLIVGAAVWVALAVADRLVRPVGELVDAARRVAAGDLTARVAVPRTHDEIGTLANAFNRMTRRLQDQTGALESRRALIEAVMSGVTAGVLSIGPDRNVRLINSSAVTLLKTRNANPVGRPLAELAPELDALLDGDDRDAIVEVSGGQGSEPRTLAVKLSRDDGATVLTFDDITQQLLDQRRAAWSDVARRIAHEIKNPLTPIQLAAERLQRRYGKQIPADDGTFTRLTETIVRQVGDLRRMVDEFSSFARMPKPVFQPEPLLDLVRQTMFLHEVAHPTIRFTLDHDEPPPVLICDRRQLGQALTNIVKNAVEAIAARGEDAPPGEIALSLTRADGLVTLVIDDNGTGLPAERDRILEPYMTTRARGTGLGLAIVLKVVEEHAGTLALTDRPGGGTRVTITLDATALATRAGQAADESPAATLVAQKGVG